MVQMERYIVGKLVQSPGGPIVEGAEHGDIGWSASFPKSLRRMDPATVDIGLNDSNTHDFPQDEGGLAAYPVSTAAGGFMLFVRGKVPHEEGQGATRGRSYRQKIYGAIPHDTWIPGMAVNLDKALADPQLTERNQELPPAGLEDASQSFSINSPYAMDIVRAVMSGHGVAIQDETRSVEDQLRIIQSAMSILPAPIARHLSFGARMGDVRNVELGLQNGNVDIGIGRRAFGDVRIIGNVLKTPSPDALDRGTAYFDFIKNAVSGVATTEEAAAKVAETLQNAGIQIDESRPWQYMAVEISEKLEAIGYALPSQTDPYAPTVAISTIPPAAPAPNAPEAVPGAPLPPAVNPLAAMTVGVTRGADDAGENTPTEPIFLSKPRTPAQPDPAAEELSAEDAARRRADLTAFNTPPFASCIDFWKHHGTLENDNGTLRLDRGTKPDGGAHRGYIRFETPQRLVFDTQSSQDDDAIILAVQYAKEHCGNKLIIDPATPADFQAKFLTAAQAWDVEVVNESALGDDVKQLVRQAYGEVPAAVKPAAIPAVQPAAALAPVPPHRGAGARLVKPARQPPVLH